MRENCTYGSEGGEGKPFPTPIRVTDRVAIVARGAGLLFTLGTDSRYVIVLLVRAVA